MEQNLEYCFAAVAWLTGLSFLVYFQVAHWSVEQSGWRMALASSAFGLIITGFFIGGGVRPAGWAIGLIAAAAQVYVAVHAISVRRTTAR